MNINKVTITGADDNSDIMELISLQNYYPFVEWGILFSNKREGTSRYPSAGWIKSIEDKGLNLSAHFCGWHSRSVIEDQNFALIKNLKGFSRVQLNYNFAYASGKNSPVYNIKHLLGFIRENPQVKIIMQYNKSNKELLDYMLNEAFVTGGIPVNLNYLYDSSGGRGKVISEIQNPFRVYTGYSGGISDVNCRDVFSLIEKFDLEDEVWVDMESGVRTNDILDFEKVGTVLSDAGYFVSKTYNQF